MRSRAARVFGILAALVSGAAVLIWIALQALADQSFTLILWMAVLSALWGGLCGVILARELERGRRARIRHRRGAP